MKSPKPLPTKPLPGFTLVELLVVVAIIGILVGLLFPGVARMLKSGDSTASTNSLRQLGLAMGVVAADNNNNLPVGYRHNASGSNRGWYHRLTHADFGTSIPMTSWIKLFENKLATKESNFKVNGAPSYPRIYNTPYGMNIFLNAGAFSSDMLYGNKAEGTWTSLKLPRVSETVILADGTIKSDGSSAHDEFQYSNAQGAASSIAYRHPGNRANLLFGDWHIKTVDREEVLAHPEWFDPSRQN